MFAYSSNLLVSYITSHIGDNIYSVIIGKFYKTSELGYYNQAHKMQTVPTYGLNNIVLTTSYPIIAKEKDERRRYELYVNLFRQFNFIQSFLVFFLITASNFVFHLLLGEKWMPSSPLFQLFMLIGLCYPLKTINSNIVKIQGKSDVYRNLTFLRTGLQIVALSICAFISLKAIVIGQVVAAFVSVSFDMFFCGKVIGFCIDKQYKNWLSIVWKPALAFFICKLMASHLDSWVINGVVSCLLFVVLEICLCVITHDAEFLLFINKLKFLIKIK